MMFVLLLSALAVCTIALPLECSKGESYWCKNLHTAKSCEAVSVCMQIWGRQSIVTDTSETCLFCQTVTEDLRKGIPAVQSDTGTYLLSVCEMIPETPLAEVCAATVRDDLPELFNLVKSDMNHRRVCGAVGLCLQGAQGLDSSVAKVGGPQDVCTDCQKFFKDLEDYLSSDKGKAALEKFVDDNFCNFLGSEAEKCVITVKEALPFALEYIKANLTPKSICAMFRLCGNTTKVPSLGMEPLCTDCRKFMKDVQAMLTNESMEKKLEQEVIKTLCENLPGLNETCASMVQAYLPDVIQLILADFPLDKFCDTIQVCNNTNSVERLMSSPLYKKAKQVVGNQEECTICQEVFNALRLIDGNPLIEAQIESFLSNQLCAKLSKTLIQECNATVQTFLPELINLVNSELTPQVICHLLSLCPNTTANPSVPQKSAANPSVLQKVQGISADVQGSEECVLCEFVLKELDQMLANNASEAEILAALDKVCSVFPDTLQVQCRDFVDMYGKSILELLLQELEPSTICRALGLCPQKHEFNQINGEEECAICKTIVIYMRSLLSKNATEQEIEKVLAKVCNFVPDTMKQDCSNFIQLYGGTLIKLLVSDVTPQEVCGILKLCQQRVTQPLLGAKECTWGPSYWCASKENAAKCKAEEHCQRYVWKK